MFAVGVYAFTCSHYLAHVFGAPDIAARAAEMAVIVILVFVNLRGVGTSGLAEDLVVVKLEILGGITAIGFVQVSTSRIQPPTDKWIGGALVGAGVILVAYERFELLSYNHPDLEHLRRTLPAALYASVAVVAFV